jgi:hypothetical protein
VVFGLYVLAVVEFGLYNSKCMCPGGTTGVLNWEMDTYLKERSIFGNNRNLIRESNYIHVLGSIERICIWESNTRELGSRILKTKFR